MEGKVDPPKHLTTFVVEHMEPYLFEWCLAEYLAMQQYLHHHPCRLLIANSQQYRHFQGKEQEDNQLNIHRLEESFKDSKGQCSSEDQSVVELHKSWEGKRVCMLDLRAEKELSSEEEWDFIVFGGVLGDHPPRDRPAPVRQHFPVLRHLGAMQLATDTAVLVSRLILCNRLALGEIPMVREPTVRGLNKQGLKTTVQMEGFSYVSKYLDIESGKRREETTGKERKETYMS